MNKTIWIDELENLNACNDALEWAQSYDSLDAAWAACHRADWMLWLLGKLSGPPKSEARKLLVLCACACARTALRFVPKGETRPLASCIKTTERWARGEASIDDVMQARRNSAASAASAAYPAAAAAAAAYAAYPAAAAAAYAYAASAAYAAYPAAARSQSLKTMADIVREHYPVAPVLGGAR